MIHSNAFIQKKLVFPHVRNFTLIYGPFSCLIDVLFGPILMEKYVRFFKYSLNFRAHALQFELNKVGYTNFAKFRLQSMSSKIEQAFEKTNKPCFYLHFTKSNLNVIFFRFSNLLFFLIIQIHNLHLIFVMNTIFYISITVIKVVKNLIFQKSLTSHETNLTLLFLSFSLPWTKTKAESPNSLQ